MDDPFSDLFKQISSKYSYPSSEHAYLLAEKIVVGSACVFSVLGALLVIFSFLYESETGFKWKEVLSKVCCGYRVTERNSNDKVVTKYRLKSYHFILINLSVADIIVASSHLWGLCSDWKHEFSPENVSAIVSGYNISCTTQATFTAFSTIASFFWTDILVIFMAFNITFIGCSNNFVTNQRRQELEGQIQGEETGIVIPEEAKAPNCCETPLFLYIVFPFFGWVVPMLMTVAFAVHKLLGYTEDYNPGWCYFYLDPHLTEHKRNMTILLGYELWLWGSVSIVLLCTVTYTVVAVCRRKQKEDFSTNCTECRYLSVGIAFTLLRVPNTIINVYLMHNHQKYRTVAVVVTNIIASATISLQGGVNGIIYLCCRKKICPSTGRRHQDYEEIR